MPGKQLSTSRIFTQRCPLPRLFQLVLLSTVILLLGGGVTLLWNVQYETHMGRAAGDVSIIGPPTVSAVTIDAIFARVGSSMVGTGKVVEQASRQTNIDDAFALGVWWTETNDGAAGVGLAYRNPGSVRGSVGYPSAYDGYTIYPSYSAAITDWFNLLHNGYVNGRGLSTVYTIARPYVGTASYPLWAAKVINLMWQYRGEAPPPPAITSTPTPRPTVNPITAAANQLRQAKLIAPGQSLSDSSSSSNLPLSLSGEMQKTAPYPTAQSTSSSSLPLSVEMAIVLFGLLTAVAIALYALRLKIETPRPELSSAPITMTATWNGLISSSMPAPSTEDLPPLPTPVPSLSSSSRLTDALPCRLIMLPSRSDPGMPVITEASSVGLLSLYGQNKRNPST
jgi:hypothetical protein